MGQILTRMDSLTEGGYTIHVVTGDRRGAGTDANVWLQLHDEGGRVSDKIKLNHTFKNDHERGETSSFSAKPVLNFGNLHKIEIWRDKFGFGHDWFVDRIEVVESFSGELFIFPIHRWIPAELHFFVTLYDCLLPHADPHQEQRRKELKAKKKIYRYTVNIENGPAQSLLLPEDEQFSHDYKWDIVTLKSTLIAQTMLIHFKVGSWDSIEDLKKVYKYSLGEPMCLDYWNEDRWFGLQRVQGVNPYLISLCEHIPSKFGVTSEMVEPFLEGLTLNEAIHKKKIFIIDLKILECVKCPNNRKVCSPLALFYVNKANDLLPIAIQLQQQTAPDNPVFLPSDPPNTWLVAKMFYNNADATYHQACSHLGFTHLLMEGVTVCTHRNLSPSHPLFKLMAPHFLFLIAINTRGLQKLISPGGWVDKTMTVGVPGLFEVISRGIQEWRMDRHGNPENEISARGVLDPEILPWYPYRDDAVAIYNCIKRYVTKIVNYYYTTQEKIDNDYELQQWRNELTKSRDLQGVGLQAVPGEQIGRFTTTDEIIETVSVIISTCSIAHAASNFQQYEEYAFPPNYPALLNGEPPKDKKPISQKDLLRLLPTKETTLDSMLITKLLSSKGTNSLGDFEVQYLYDPYAVNAAETFRKELETISKKIKERNRVLSIPYPYLDPEIVPNSISI